MSIGGSRAPANRSLTFPDELATLALEHAGGLSVPRIWQCLDELWSSTATGAPAIFVRAFRRRCFAAIVVHGSPQLPGLYAITQPSKIIEGLNLHWLRTLGNSDNKDLVLTSFHSLMDVGEMNEVIFRYQGLFASVFMVDCNRPSCAHRNFPQNYSTLHFGQGLSRFNRREWTKKWNAIVSAEE